MRENIYQENVWWTLWSLPSRRIIIWMYFILAASKGHHAAKLFLFQTSGGLLAVGSSPTRFCTKPVYNIFGGFFIGIYADFQVFLKMFFLCSNLKFYVWLHQLSSKTRRRIKKILHGQIYFKERYQSSLSFRFLKWNPQTPSSRENWHVTPMPTLPSSERERVTWTRKER